MMFLYFYWIFTAVLTVTISTFGLYDLNSSYIMSLQFKFCFWMIFLRICLGINSMFSVSFYSLTFINKFGTPKQLFTLLRDFLISWITVRYGIMKNLRIRFIYKMFLFYIWNKKRINHWLVLNFRVIKISWSEHFEWNKNWKLWKKLNSKVGFFKSKILILKL